MIQDVLLKIAEGTKPSAVAVGQLSGMSTDDLPVFRTLWTELDLGRRAAVLTLAVQLSEDDVELDFNALFRACLADPAPTVRAAAIEGLWEDEEFRTADTLATMLRQDPDVRVRTAAALGLARFAVRVELGTLYRPVANRVCVALFQSANDVDEEADVRRRAIEALGAISEPEVTQLIESAWANTDSKFRASALYAMGRSGNDRWFETVLRELENDDPELRFEAARAAGEFQNARAVVPLINHLQDDDLEVKLAAIASLAEIGGDVARRALQRCVKSTDQAIRSAATEALAEMDLDSDPLTTSPFLNDSTPTI